MTLTYEVRKTTAGTDYVRIDSRGAITQEDAQGYFDRLQPSAAWGRLHVLIIATDPSIDVHNEARAIFGSKTLAEREGHTLVVLTSVPLRVLVQFLLRISGAGKKTHLFADESKAMAWLEAPPPAS